MKFTLNKIILAGWICLVLTGCDSSGNGPSSSLASATSLSSSPVTGSSASSSSFNSSVSVSSSSSDSSATTSEATLVWTRAVMNVDGSPLSDLTGYNIYYGTNASQLSSLQAAGAAQTSTVISGLVKGITYYFAISSISATGGEGAMSASISKIL